MDLLLRKQNKKDDVSIYNLKINAKGLTAKEADLRLQKYGLNTLKEKKKSSPVLIFLSQFNDFIIWVLFGATVLSSLMGEKADAITITAIIILNGIMGFIQEYRTEKSMEALKELTAPEAHVVRDGKNMIILAKEIVPDDLILLEAGDRVPADAILIECLNIEVDESLLTGESAPVSKKAVAAKNTNSLLGAKQNIVYMGTTITGGRGKSIVIATGMATEMGKIADMLQNTKESLTPLQVRLDKMGKAMVAACLLICGIVTVTGILKGEDIYTMFLIGVSLAVAAIPEGLPAIVTVSLALGVQRMLKKNALIRKLPAVETLGCTNIICSDKTGTLTENKMTVKSIYTSGNYIEVSGTGYDINGQFIKNSRKISPSMETSLKSLLESAVLCTNSEIEVKKSKSKIINIGDKKEEVSVQGDPTEIALIVCGYKAGVTKENLMGRYTKVSEVPFDSDRKRMSVIVKSIDGSYYLFLKGAPDNTIDLCKDAQAGSLGNQKPSLRPMNAILKNNILSANDNMAKKALRVIAIAYKKLPGIPPTMDASFLEKDLTFLGLMGMIDPPRPEAIKAIELCKASGIKPVMITGDHRETAIAVARELKLIEKENGKNFVLTGAELDRLNENELNKAVRETSVFARVTPKHKLNIVKAYKNNGFIVAMTGDGVNDAPAVKEADIGISMGETGTDVTKEASSMILLDDNFATIVAAVEEGRIIYDNIRKFIRYLLSCNLGEVLTMFIASLIGLPIPLMPIQILWVNLVTDGLPAIALGVDPPDNDIMSRAPRGKNESIFSQGLGIKIIIRGILIGVCTLIVFTFNLKYYNGDNVLLRARTMAFATLVMSQLIHVFECRSERHSIFEIKLFSNMYLVLAVMVSIIMLSIVIYIPYLQYIFKTVALTFGDWIEVLFFSGAISLVVSLERYIKKK
jgi:Ca2+-transporting ATPase